MNSNLAVIITAAGSSTRMGGGIKKEYLPLNNGTVLSGCAKTFFKSLSEKYTISQMIITCPKNGQSQSLEALKKDSELVEIAGKWNDKGLSAIDFVEGGKSRQESVFNAVKAVKNADYVLIHDGARPFVTGEIILAAVAAAIEFGAAAPGITPTDTQKEIDENGFITRHLVRSRLTAIQTPQVFEFKNLLEAHKKAAEEASETGKEFTDDTEIWGNYFGKVKIVPGDVKNKKITYKGDL